MHTGYTILKKTLRPFHDHLLLRGRKVVGGQNLPRRGERFFIACNHENTANDPLNIIFSMPDNMRVGALARANVFYLSKPISRFLRWLGLKPAFRAGWEGGDAVEKNEETFREISQVVNAGEPFIVFPAAGHSQGHYLPPFTTGIVRMAFYALEQNGWRDDVKIVPTSLFYDDYFALRSDVMWTIGQPISLIGYKEQYAEHPFKTLRQIRGELKRRIELMTLDEGEDNCQELDFLRRTSLCDAQGDVEQRFRTISRFVDSVKQSEHIDEIVAEAHELRLKEQALGMGDGDDSIAGESHTALKATCGVVAALALLPLWIASLWPAALVYHLPTLLLKEDKMFTNSYRFIIGVLVLYPLFAILTLAAGIAMGHWLATLLWIALWLPLGQFCWHYWQGLRRTLIRLRCLLQPKRTKEIIELRNKIRKLLKP